MSLADLIKRSPRHSPAHPARAFGAEEQTMEEIRRQTFVPPRPTMAEMSARAGELLDQLRHKLHRESEPLDEEFGAYYREPEPPRRGQAPVYSADTYAREAAPELGWENPFTAGPSYADAASRPVPPRSGRSAYAPSAAYEDAPTYAPQPELWTAAYSGSAPASGGPSAGYEDDYDEWGPISREPRRRAVPARPERTGTSPGYAESAGYPEEGGYAGYAGYTGYNEPPGYAEPVSYGEPAGYGASVGYAEPAGYGGTFGHGEHAEYAESVDHPAAYAGYSAPAAYPPEEAGYAESPVYAEPAGYGHWDYAAGEYGEGPMGPPPGEWYGGGVMPRRARPARPRLKPGDLQYFFWSGTIVAGLFLTLGAFVYACLL